MKSLMLAAILVIFSTFSGLLVWMNLTPGYFQYGECGCSVGYYTDDQATVKKTKNTPDELFLPPTICQCAAQSKARTFIGAIELLLAKLDLNRGPRPLPSEDISPQWYTCPKTEWVDCMPGPGPVKSQCQPDYLNWASKNCPGFKGGAM